MDPVYSTTLADWKLNLKVEGKKGGCFGGTPRRRWRGIKIGQQERGRGLEGKRKCRCGKKVGNWGWRFLFGGRDRGKRLAHSGGRRSTDALYLAHQKRGVIALYAVRSTGKERKRGMALPVRWIRDEKVRGVSISPRCSEIMFRVALLVRAAIVNIARVKTTDVEVTLDDDDIK